MFNFLHKMETADSRIVYEPELKINGTFSKLFENFEINIHDNVPMKEMKIKIAKTKTMI